MRGVVDSDKIIVFVENDHNRAALLYKRMNDRDRGRTFWVKTVKEAIDILKDYRTRLDIVSLGYNFSGKDTHPHPANEECGMQIVRWLEKQSIDHYSHVKFIVHTWELSAGIKMTRRLRKKGYKIIRIPFGL